MTNKTSIFQKRTKLFQMLGWWPELFQGFPKNTPTLLEGKRTRIGRNVSEFKNRTPRLYRPNIIRQKLFSELLDKQIEFRLSTTAARTIDKKGGLDAYMLTKPDQDFECEHALKIKKDLEQAFEKAQKSQEKAQKLLEKQNKQR